MNLMETKIRKTAVVLEHPLVPENWSHSFLTLLIIQVSKFCFKKWLTMAPTKTTRLNEGIRYVLVVTNKKFNVTIHSLYT